MGGRQLDFTRRMLPLYRSFGPYQMDGKELCVKTANQAAPLWLSAPFEVVAHTRDRRNQNWGKLLRWRDLDEVEHEHVMRDRDLFDDAELWRMPLDLGLRICMERIAREHLRTYVAAVWADDRVYVVECDGRLIVEPVIASEGVLLVRQIEAGELHAGGPR